MKTLTQFYPFVEPEVMGCPYPLIDHHLRLAIREFCDRTKVWQEWADAVTLDGTTNTLDADVASGQDLVSVLRAILNDEDIEVFAEADLPADWQKTTPSVLQDALVLFGEAQFMLFPMPTSGDVLRVQQAVQPSLTATSVGDVLFTKYADDVAAGCKARLMAMLQQAWGNEKQAGYYARRFDQACRDTANVAAMSKSSRRMKPCP